MKKLSKSTETPAVVASLPAQKKTAWLAPTVDPLLIHSETNAHLGLASDLALLAS